MSKFCPIPWNMSAMRNNGDYRVCCHANISDGRGLVVNEEQIMNAADVGPEAVRNSTTLKQMRLEMMRQVWPSACERCRLEEESGLKSRREMENEKVEADFEAHCLSHTKEDGSVDTEKIPLERLDLRLGNKCNLKCRMCGPTDSDAWYRDHAEIWGKEFKDTHGSVSLKEIDGKLKTENGDYDWIVRDSFWDSLTQNLDGLKYVHIVGGEPLLIEEHFKFLKICCDRGIASKITLEYNTNLSVLPEPILDLWKEFKEVKIGVSLDGVGLLNDYIRYPSKWSVIENNLKVLQSLPEKNITVWLSFSVQILNILNIVETMRWKINSPFHKMKDYFHKKIISTHPVHKPHHLCTQALPSSIKKQVERHLRSDLEEFLQELNLRTDLSSGLKEHYRQSSQVIVEGHIHFMNEKDLSEEFKNFLSINHKLDALRGQSLKEGNPLLWSLLKESGL